MTNRPIKFRAWDKKFSMMHYDIATYHWTLGNIANGDPKGWAWMQSTNLFDTKGKEIFEGDIVKLHCSGKDGVCSRYGVTATIEWKNDYAMFDVVIHDKKVLIEVGPSKGKKVSMREIHIWAGSHTCLSKHGTSWGYIEVVGNIYQNPKLAK